MSRNDAQGEEITGVTPQHFLVCNEGMGDEWLVFLIM
jgi:hypothetical protein